jgi:hypothetical protein
MLGEGFKFQAPRLWVLAGYGKIAKNKTHKCSETGPESSARVAKATKINSKTSPTHVEGSRCPDSDPILM